MATGQITDEDTTRQFGAIDAFIDTRFGEWQKWRRHLHTNPELSWHEVDTTAFIGEQLQTIGLTLTAGPKQLGGFVDLQNPTAADGLGAGKLIAIRGDIDAIPVNEETGLDFCSQVPGVMHACGHDVHATVVLAVCDTLQHLKAEGLVQEPLPVRAIFQPAEEVAQGATEMMALGVLEGVERMISMHVDPNQDVGNLGFRDGVQTACCDEIAVSFAGPGGHGARPHEAADPIFAAAQFINAAYASVPRMTDARHSIVLSFCHIAGGQSSNVIPTDVKIHGTLRSFDAATRSQVFQQLTNLANTIGMSLGVKIDFVPGVSIPSVNNCDETNRLLKDAALSFVAPESISEVAKSLGGEDFACYQAHVPGALVRIGSARGDHGSAHLHSPHFDVDEQVIRLACRLFTRAILNWTRT